MMREAHEPGSGARRARPAGWLAVLTLFLITGAAWAQTGVDRDLHRQVHERYRVLPLTDGLVLEPRDGEAATIEVRDGGVAVDGTAVDAAELDDRFGDRAAGLVAVLLELDAEGLRQIAQPPAASSPEPSQPQAAGPAAAPAVPATPGVPAAPPPPPPAAPAPPPPPRQVDDRVMMGGNLEIGPHEAANDVVVFGGSLHMDGTAYGDVVLFGGSATITGHVHGDSVLFGGSLRLEDSARVDGDLVVIGGSLHRDPGAQVGGEVTDSFTFGADFWPFARRGLTGWGQRGDHGFTVAHGLRSATTRFAKFLVMALLASIVVLIFRRPLLRVSDRARVEPLKAGLIGLAVEILIMPVTVLVVLLLAISIIGIPLLLVVPVALLLGVVFAFFGYCAVLHRLGETLLDRLGATRSHAIVSVLVGLGMLSAFGILGGLLSFRPISPLGGILSAIGVVVAYLVWTVGLGAVVLEWSRSRRHRGAVSAPPPASGTAFPEAYDRG